jgi:DNA invertase Pin-like site-specific DNA recombinase
MRCSRGGLIGSSATSATWCCCWRICKPLGVGFVSLNERIDLGTPVGRLQLHILAALSEFERNQIQQRVRAGLARVRAQGKRLGRLRSKIPVQRLLGLSGWGTNGAAVDWAFRWRR